VLNAAQQDGYIDLHWGAPRFQAPCKRYEVKLETLMYLLVMKEKYDGIKVGGWLYSPSSGSIRNVEVDVYMMLYPYPLPIKSKA
jgi:hypothetical protein